MNKDNKTSDTYTPTEYFNLLKEKKHKINDEELKQFYNNCLILLNKYKITGQTKAMKKLIFHIESIEKEREIVKLGFNTFVYRDDIEEYIDNVANDVVKIIDLENYEREIPDDVVQRFEKVKDIFDQSYVVFTDYTGEIERKVQQERREKDPILFGTFQDKSTKTLIDRFYYIGDWVDEYCDLTLDKMISEVKKELDKDISFTIQTPKDIDELKQQLNKLNKTQNGDFRMTNNIENKKSFFKKIFSFMRNNK